MSAMASAASNFNEVPVFPTALGGCKALAVASSASISSLVNMLSGNGRWGSTGDAPSRT